MPTTGSAPPGGAWKTDGAESGGVDWTALSAESLTSECGAPSRRAETPRSGPMPPGYCCFPPRGVQTLQRRSHRFSRRAFSARPPAPARVPGGVKRSQRLLGELVCAEEEHTPGRLLADSGVPAVLSGEGPAEPGQSLPLGGRPAARGATAQPRSPAAPHQKPHSLCPQRPTPRRRVGAENERSGRGLEGTRWAGPASFWGWGLSDWKLGQSVLELTEEFAGCIVAFICTI